MIYNKSIGERFFDICNISFLVFLMIITLYPFIYVALASISNPMEIVRHRGILLKPLGLSFGAYKMVFDNPMIAIGYQNTLFYVIVGTIVNMLMTSLGAYVLSRKGPYWRNTIMFIIVFTMFFSGGIIPFYLLVRNLGLVNSRWALIFPTAINTWNLIVMRTSFMSIPESMEESARIDGAGDITILFRIIIPLSIPVMAVMTLFYGVGHWNAWFNAMIFLRERTLYPLQIFLREILIANVVDDMVTGMDMLDREPIAETIKYATVMVATVPILLAYPFLQKYFVKGIMVGAIKG